MANIVWSVLIACAGALLWAAIFRRVKADGDLFPVVLILLVFFVATVVGLVLLGLVFFGAADDTTADLRWGIGLLVGAVAFAANARR